MQSCRKSSYLWKKLSDTNMEWTSRYNETTLFLKVVKVAILMPQNQLPEQIAIRLFRLTWFGQKILQGSNYKNFL